MNINFFFFFQAADGIRDKLVTGVRTCALPICDGLHADICARWSLKMHGVDMATGRLGLHKTHGFPDRSGVQQMLAHFFSASGAVQASDFKIWRIKSRHADIFLRDMMRQILAKTAHAVLGGEERGVGDRVVELWYAADGNHRQNIGTL